MSGNTGAKKVVAARRRRARQTLMLRRVGAGLFALLALAVALLAIAAAPGLSAIVWGAAAALLLGQAALLLLKRPLPLPVYALTSLACLLLILAGGGARNHALNEGAFVKADLHAPLSQSLPDGEGLPEAPLEATALPESSEAAATAESGSPEAAATPEPTPVTEVELLGRHFSLDAVALDLTNADEIDPAAINAALGQLTMVQTVDLRGTPADADTIAAIRDANPEVRFMFSCAVPSGDMTTEDATVVVPVGTYEDLRAYVSFIDYMPNLQSMDATNVALTGAQIAELQADPRARKLIYNFTAFGRSLSTLDTELNLDNTTIADVAELERVLSAMPRLTRVSMCNCGLEDSVMAGICDSHPEIKFIWWVHFGKYTLRTDATAFTTNLYASKRYGYTSATFWPLQYCTDLMMLDIGHCKLTSIDAIAKMKKLRVLILADNKITDISALSELEDLEYVEVFLNKITDLTPLANKLKLLDLNLYYNPIGDVSPICTCTSLERLWIGECNLSSGQLSKLRKALPNCRINTRGSASTGNGWREHRRYRTIKQMYKKGEYIPFS